MFPRVRAAFRAFAAAEIREPSAMELAAVTPIEDWDDLPADSTNPLKVSESWPQAALRYPPLLRCVSMVASECARLVASSVTVSDADGMASLERRDVRNTGRLRQSVDGGVSPAIDFWKDAFTDLLTDGNALIIPTRNSDGVLTRLRLMRSEDAEYQEASDAFFGKVVGESDDRVVRVPRVEMAHARMFGAPYRRSTGRRGREWPFSDSPVRLLAPTLGLSGRIEAWLYRTLIGPKGNLVMSPRQGRMSDGQQKTLAAQVRRFMGGRKPLVAGSPLTVSQFGQSAREADINNLLGHQLREVARVYGVPLPLIGSPVSAWGSGIEALAREYWKRAVAPRIADVLVPLSHRICAPGRSLTVDPLELIRGESGDAAALIQVLRPNNGPAIGTLDECRKIASLPPATPEQRAELEEGNRAAVPAGAEEGAPPAPAEETAEAPGAEEEEPAMMPSPADLERQMAEMLADCGPEAGN